MVTILRLQNKTVLICFLLFFFTSCTSNNFKDKSINDKKADLFYSHGTSNLLQKNYTDALSNLLEAKKYRPNDSKIINNLAMAYYFKGQTILAIETLKDSLEINQKNSDSRNNLASIYYRLGKFDKAEEQYKLIQNDLVYKHQYRVYYNLALIYKKKNNLKDAKKNLLESIREKNDYCPANYQLGMLKTKERDFDGALAYFQDATKSTCYNSPDGHYQVALTYMHLKDYQKAQATFQVIIKQFPNSKESYLSRTKILNWDKELKKAQKKTNLSKNNFLTNDIFEKTNNRDQKQSSSNSNTFIKTPNF